MELEATRTDEAVTPKDGGNSTSGGSSETWPDLLSRFMQDKGYRMLDMPNIQAQLCRKQHEKDVALARPNDLQILDT